MPAQPTHPTPDSLRDYSVGRATDALSDDIARHLKDCGMCAASLDDLPPSRADELLRRGATPRRGGPTQNLPAIPGYEVLGVLGHGGMGVVYDAIQLSAKRKVAIKVLDEALAADAAICERFFQAEVYRHANLNHENIVHVIDAGKVDGIPYAVMEYVEGKTLAEMVKDDGPLPVETVCDIATKVVSALEYLHGKEVTHRDIKPANIMVSVDGKVKILDLGLARVSGRGGAGGDLTQQGGLLGTLRYMPPEQARSSVVDSRADIYSLAYTLYTLLTGVVPFADLDGIDLIEAHSKEEPTPVAKLRAGVPKWLLKVLEKMMAKNLQDRYQTPAEVAADLSRAGKIGRRLRRYVIPAAVAAAVLLAGVGVAAVAQAGPFARVRGPNEVLTTEAFQAFERGDHESAKKKADECISNFRKDAVRRQKELAEQGAPKPPVGKANRSLLERIRGEGPADVLLEGPLNDSATSYWLAGRCALQLGQVTAARAAWEAGATLTYSRCWDPKTKLLWQPALKCADELDNLNSAGK